jgi:hypothetical protein
MKIMDRYRVSVEDVKPAGGKKFDQPNMDIRFLMRIGP